MGQAAPLRVTYIHHSSFLAETPARLLLFDYYEGALPALPDKPLFVFASHRHPDHFSFDIYRLGRPEAVYILSKDIRRKYNEGFFRRQGVTEAQLKNTHFLPAGETLRLGGLEVSALRSTDEGVAFSVEAEGRRVYHAGDLNLWLWPEDTPGERREMAAAFEKEIEQLKGKAFDAAFLPLDPRQGEDFYLGFHRFMELTDTEAAYPMHCWGDFSVIGRLKAMDCSAPYRSRVAGPDFYRKQG